MKQRPQKHRLKTSLRADQTYLMASETKRRLQSFVETVEPRNPERLEKELPHVTTSGSKVLGLPPLACRKPPDTSGHLTAITRRSTSCGQSGGSGSERESCIGRSKSSK